MLSDVGTIIDLSDHQWNLVADLFDPVGRQGTPARHPSGGWSRRCSTSPDPLPVAVPA